MTLSLWLANLVKEELSRRRVTAGVTSEPNTLTAEQRERWRLWLREAVTEVRVGDGGQLAKMMGTTASVGPSATA